MRLSSVVSIAAMAVFALTNFAPLGLVAAFAWGAGSGGNWVFSCAELQRLAPRTMIGRIASMDQLSFMMVESFTAIGAALPFVDTIKVSATTHSSFLAWSPRHPESVCLLSKLMRLNVFWQPVQLYFMFCR